MKVPHSLVLLAMILRREQLLRQNDGYSVGWSQILHSSPQAGGSVYIRNTVHVTSNLDDFGRPLRGHFRRANRPLPASRRFTVVFNAERIMRPAPNCFRFSLVMVPENMSVQVTPVGHITGSNIDTSNAAHS